MCETWQAASVAFGASRCGAWLFAILCPFVAAGSVSVSGTNGATALPQISGQESDKAESRELSYAADVGAVGNPERGYYLGSGRCDRQPFDAQALRRIRGKEGITLVICVYYLDRFRSAPLSADTLAFFERQMDAVRAAGMKAIVRFAYSDRLGGEDADAERMAMHIAQLAPLLGRHQDVLFVLQEGFIGAWGEGAISTHFGTTGNLHPRHIAARRTLSARVLSMVPPNRFVQVRTPALKRMLYGPQAIDRNRRSGGGAARTGHFNDCFLHGVNDSGTYTNPTMEYPFLEQDTLGVPMGGETCGLARPRTDCPTALAELRRFHWTYLNASYHQEVLRDWRRQGCYAEIGKSLGYRLVLTHFNYKPRASAGASWPVSIRLSNRGWAAPVHERPMYLVLQSRNGKEHYFFDLAVQVRLWLPDTSISIAGSLELPARMAPGVYDVMLMLPDPAPTLAPRPEYAIRFANRGLWDGRHGWNRTGATVTVGRP